MPHPSRSLRFTGASNFRDLGGYSARDGRSVRWRRLFRSDHLAGLTGEDAGRMAELGLVRAVDLRSLSERAAEPYHLPGVAQHSLPIEPMVLTRMKELTDAGQPLTAAEAERLMQQTYRAFVHDNADRFAELFRLLLAEDAPLVFHCTAGKDRTGFAAALVLLALEVPRPVVMQDYLLTNELYRRPPLTSGRASPEVLDVLWRVQEPFLEAALHAVDADYGGIETYLRQRLGVGDRERARLAALYLQKA